MTKRITRREFLIKPAVAAVGLAAMGVASACQPKVVKETVLVEKPVEKVVEKEVTKEVVKEVQKEVTKVVVKEVTAKPVVRESITLTYNTWWPTMADNLTVVIPIFEARNPWIKIEQQVLPYNEWIQKYQTTMVAGTAADTFCGNLFISPKFYQPKYHMDMTDALLADGIDLKKEYFITATELWCGRVYGMPFDMDTNAMFYNKDLMKKYYGKDLWADMGGKWDINDWVEIMKACTQDSNKDGKLDIWGGDGHMPNHENWNQSMSFTRGGSIFDYSQMKYTWTSEIAMDTARMGWNWWTKDKIYVPPEESAALAQAGVPSPFAGGVAATRYRAVADVPRFIAQVGNKFKWDCALLPGLTKDKPGVALLAGNPNLVNAASKNRDAGYQFIKFLAGEDVQKYFATRGICVPTLKKMIPLFKDYPEVEHSGIWAEVPQNDYHIHILHYNAIECRTITGARFQEVYTAGADLKVTIENMNAELNTKVAYGECLPFAGMKHPIPGGQLVQ
ncbi:MAG: ABC transporter substrate-binding protein [Chloroflexota bacterium]